MSNIAMKPGCPPQALDARRTFETALAQILQSGETRSLSKTPIYCRTQTATAGNPVTEKQALTDAARALAQLWNISPALVRRGG